jgi:F-type H+-transporting ATPase subunit delta
MAATGVAKRYARALLELASERGQLEGVATELAQFDQALTDAPQLKGVLITPGLPLETRLDVLKDVLRKAGASETTRNLLLILTERGRLPLLGDIAAAYKEQADHAAGRIRAKVTSAGPLSEGQVGSIRSAFEKTTGKQVVVEVEEDPALLGGVITEIGGTVHDGSLRSQLRRLRAELAR